MLRVKNFKYLTTHTYRYKKTDYVNFGFEFSYHKINRWMLTFYLGHVTFRILKFGSSNYEKNKLI